MPQKRQRGKGVAPCERKLENPHEGCVSERVRVSFARRTATNREGEGGEGGGNSNGDGTNGRREDMSAVESALDVLSRAATMVQGQFSPFGIFILSLSIVRRVQNV